MIQFSQADKKIGGKEKEKLQSFISDRQIESASLLATSATQGNASKARISLDGIIQSVTTFLLEANVPPNQIRVTLLPNKNASIDKNQLILICKFGAKKGERVLKKTSIVEISEVEYNRSPTTPAVAVEKKETPKKEKQEPLELLDKKAFKKNETIELPNLLFEPGTHFLLPGSEKVLNELLAVMNENQKLRIELQGHICCRLGGADGYDPTTGLENLSEMRAKVVYLYLIEKGIDAYRMKFKGFGSSRKLHADESNSFAQMRNRRVEVLVIDTN